MIALSVTEIVAAALALALLVTAWSFRGIVATIAGSLTMLAFARYGRPRFLLTLGTSLCGRGAARWPSGSEDKAAAISAYADCLAQRFRVTHDQADLDAAVEQATRADEWYRAHPTRDGIRPTSLPTHLYTRYRERGDDGDLVRAVELGRENVEQASEGDRAVELTNLGEWLAALGIRRGDPALLDEAIATIRAGLPATGRLLARPTALTSLGSACLSRFELTGDATDLADAQAHMQDALRIGAGREQAHNRLPALQNLAQVLWRSYERSGDEATLAEAVGSARAAVGLSDGYRADRAVALSTLAVLLTTRFEDFGNLADAREAASALDDAVAVAVATDPRRAGYLAAKGRLLRLRYLRTGDADDLDLAESCYDDALGSVPVDDPDRVLYQSNLANTLLGRFGESHRRRDLDRAIRLSQDAADARPGSALRALALHGHAVARYVRAAERDGDGDADRDSAADDLTLAIDAARESVALRAPDDPNRALSLRLLAHCHTARSQLPGAAADGDRRAASVALGDIVATTSAPPRLRASAAVALARLEHGSGDSAVALALYTTAVDLLPQIPVRMVDRSDQEFGLRDLGELGPESAACALDAGSAERAVVLLESGRSILWQLAGSSREPLAGLRAVDPRLADRGEAIRRAWDVGSVPAAPAGSRRGPA